MDMVVFDLFHGLVVQQRRAILDLWKARERQVNLNGKSFSQ